MPILILIRIKIQQGCSDLALAIIMIRILIRLIVKLGKKVCATIKRKKEKRHIQFGETEKIALLKI